MNGVTLVYGAPGVGKSTLLVAAAEGYARSGAVLVLDLTGDLARGLAPKFPKTLRKFSSGDEYRRATRGFFRPSEWRAGDVVVITPHAGRLETAVSLWLALVQSPQHRGLFAAALCDESEQLFPVGAPIPAPFRESVLFARNERRALVLATKRPTAISPTLRSAAMRLAVFRVQSDADAKACEELGPSKLFRGRVQALPRGKYLYYEGAEHTPDSVLPLHDSRDAPPWLRSK